MKAFRLLFRKKHDFDMENPLIDNPDFVNKHSLEKWAIYGWKCKNCGEIIWFDREHMKTLPRYVRNGCKGKKD